MDLPTLRGLVTLVLMIAFIGVVVWAWSGKRKKDFEEAARLPLEEEPPAGGESGEARRDSRGDSES